MSEDTGLGWTHSVAGVLGAPEPGLRLVLGQLAGYPLLLLYRRHIANKDTNTQHLFFFLSGINRWYSTLKCPLYLLCSFFCFLGLILAYWVIGDGVTHSLYTIFSTYLIFLCLGGSIYSVIATFLLNMSYLLAGYWWVIQIMPGAKYLIIRHRDQS